MLEKPDFIINTFLQSICASLLSNQRAKTKIQEELSENVNLTQTSTDRLRLSDLNKNYEIEMTSTRKMDIHDNL